MENTPWVSIVVRPMLLAFWLAVAWGTFYGLALLWSALALGPGEALERALSGRDGLAGMLNVWLAALAFLVWGIVGVLAWRSRRSAR